MQLPPFFLGRPRGAMTAFKSGASRFLCLTICCATPCVTCRGKKKYRLCVRTQHESGSPLKLEIVAQSVRNKDAIGMNGREEFQLIFLHLLIYFSSLINELPFFLVKCKLPIRTYEGDPSVLDTES